MSAQPAPAPAPVLLHMIIFNEKFQRPNMYFGGDLVIHFLLEIASNQVGGRNLFLIVLLC